MPHLNLSESFKHNILLLKVVGAWSFENNILYSIYKNILACASFLMYLLSIIDVILNFNNREVMENVYNMPALLESPIKLVMFRKNFEKILKTLAILQSSHFQAKNKNQKEILQKAIFYSKLLQILYFFVTVVSVGALLIFPLIKGDYKLFILLWLPFEYKKPFYFQIVYSYIFIFSTLCAYVNVATDTFLYISWIQIGAQFDCVSNTLTSLKISEELAEEKILIKCVQHYNKILQYVKLLNDAYYEIIIVQVIAATLALCITMYQMSLVSGIFVKNYSRDIITVP